DFTDKQIFIHTVPVVVGCFTAAALFQSGADLEIIIEQLKEMTINKYEVIMNLIGELVGTFILVLL
ncbi:hypothetical protein ACJBXB_10480, partial [Streptococcus suis]